MQNINITIFKNDYKKEEKHPDYKAYTQIKGKLEQVGAAWKKEKNGKTFLSLSLQAVPLMDSLMEAGVMNTGIAPQASTMPVVDGLPPKVYQTTLAPEQVKEIQDARNAEIEQRKINESLEMESDFNNI